MKNFKDIVKEVEGYSDKLNQKVEPRVFDLVVALRMLDFQTLVSCEGHLEQRYFFTPHVMFCSEDYDIENKCGATAGNEEKLLEMIGYLNEFYQIYPEIEHQYRFTCNVIPGLVVELQTLDRYTVDVGRNWNEKFKIHQLHKKQLKDFTDFMISKVGDSWE